jgi:hypothetical protein
MGEESPVPQEQERVAPLGLVHDVARDEQCRSLRSELVEQTPEIAPQDRIEPDGRLVEDEQARCAEERDGERDACTLPAREPADDAVALFLASSARSTASARAPTMRAKKRRFSRMVKSS